MDNFRALPKLNEKLEEMVSSGEARLATVVASYGNEVEVTVTGGARARFPSTHHDPPVGSSGALIATRGGGRLFVASDVMRPITKNSPALAGRNGISTTGNYTVPATPTTANTLVLFTGLVPGRFYRLSWQCTYSVWISGTTNARWAVRIIHGGGTLWSGYNAHINLINQQFGYHWNHSAVVTANTNGEISICPGVQWNAGQINVTWATVTATLSEE